MATPSAITPGVRFELRCLQCGRFVATVIVTKPDQSRIVHLHAPQYEEAVRRRVCPHCHGRLMLEDTEPVTLVDLRRLAREDLTAPVRRGRGRRPKQTGPGSPHRERQRKYRGRLVAGLVVQERWARGYDACVECHRTDSRHNTRGLCNRCRNRAARRQGVAS